MRKFTFLIVLCIAIPLNAQTYVPDDNFERALIEFGYDSGELDDYVDTEKIINVTSLDLSNKSIESLTGIEDFINLKLLNCANNKLFELDLSSNNLEILDASNNPELAYIDCNDNDLSSLNITNNIELVFLGCYGNNLTTLDITTNIKLEQFECYANAITNLDVSNNVLLTDLFCEYNNLKELDVSNNNLLMTLVCTGNQLTSLDISNNVLLKDLLCNHNYLKYLDLSDHKNLLYLDCSENDLEELNVKNGNNVNLVDFDTTLNSNLACIQVDSPNYMNESWGSAKDENALYAENCSNLNIDNNFTNEFIISKNPVKDILEINATKGLELLSVEFYTVNGVFLFTKHNSNINLEHLSSGIYFIKIHTNRGISIKKIIKE